MQLTRKEKEKLITLLSAEITKAHLRYNHNHPYLELLYGIRDKVLKEEVYNEANSSI